MKINNTLPPTNPYHIARAYGAGSSPQARPAAPVDAVKSVDRQATLPDQVQQRLVAGVVPGGVEFDASGTARPAAPVIPLYRHPAEKNAAATAVQVGRSLDVTG